MPPGAGTPTAVPAHPARPQAPASSGGGATWPQRACTPADRRARTGGAAITAYGCDADEAERFATRAPAHGIVPTTTPLALTEGTARWAAGGRCASVSHRSPVGARELRALRDAGVEHLSTRSVGVDHIDLAEAASLGIEVVGVGYEPDGVADFTVMLILMAIRNAAGVVESAQRREFRLGGRGRDLCDLTVGVVGAGRIGRAVLRRLRGFGCATLASTRGDVRALEGTTVVPLDVLLRRSDVVTLHVPLDTTTHHLLGAEAIAHMRPGAVLVNTSRGAVVDTSALISALEGGRLGGAALDVVEGEGEAFHRDGTGEDLDPLLVRLLALPNVIVTPHTAFHTTRALHDTVDRTLTTCLTFERNRCHGETDDRHRVRGLLGGA